MVVKTKTNSTLWCASFMTRTVKCASCETNQPFVTLLHWTTVKEFPISHHRRLSFNHHLIVLTNNREGLVLNGSGVSDSFPRKPSSSSPYFRCKTRTLRIPYLRWQPWELPSSRHRTAPDCTLERLLFFLSCGVDRLAGGGVAQTQVLTGGVKPSNPIGTLRRVSRLESEVVSQFVHNLRPSFQMNTQRPVIDDFKTWGIWIRCWCDQLNEYHNPSPTGPSLHHLPSPQTILEL